MSQASSYQEAEESAMELNYYTQAEDLSKHQTHSMTAEVPWRKENSQASPGKSSWNPPICPPFVLLQQQSSSWWLPWPGPADSVSWVPPLTLPIYYYTVLICILLFIKCGKTLVSVSLNVFSHCLLYFLSSNVYMYIDAHKFCSTRLRFIFAFILPLFSSEYIISVPLSSYSLVVLCQFKMNFFSKFSIMLLF